MRKLLLITFIGISVCVFSATKNLIGQPLGYVIDSVLFSKIDSIFGESGEEFKDSNGRSVIRYRDHGFYNHSNTPADQIITYRELGFYQHSDTLFKNRNKNIDFDSTIWIVITEMADPDTNYYLVYYNTHRYTVPRKCHHGIIAPTKQKTKIKFNYDVLMSSLFPVMILKKSNGEMIEYDNSSSIYFNYTE